MRAIAYERFGPAKDVLNEIDLPRPVPKAGEVLVQLIYSGVNPSDVKARAGLRPGVSKPAYDLIVPHSDGSGVITAVGAGGDAARIGQRVWVWNGQWARPYGTMAEFIALPQEQAVPLPDGISMECGASFGIPGLTAAHCLLGGEDIGGKTVLICGGAGAVGHIAVQLAKWAGARVIATASAKNHARVHAAGADHVLEYMAPTLAEDIKKICPEGVDRAVELEFGANAALLGDVMRPMGTIAAYGSALDMTPTVPFGQYLFKALKIDISLIYILPAPERQKAIEALHAAHLAGAFTSSIDQIYDFEDCAQAHDEVLKGGRAGASLIKI